MLQTESINTQQFFKNALKEMNLETSRIHLLKSIAEGIAQEIKIGNRLNINYICTHNSRRSQLAQVWSSYASNYYKLRNVWSYSGGTAVTAFYRNTVKALQETGFDFEILEFSHRNPTYSINYDNAPEPIVGFSKLYDDRHNKKPFIAITTCSNADEKCPFIPDALRRFHLPFVDPKDFDNTKIHSEKYMEVNKQISGEIHFIFKKIADIL